MRAVAQSAGQIQLKFQPWLPKYRIDRGNLPEPTCEFLYFRPMISTAPSTNAERELAAGLASLLIRQRDENVDAGLAELHAQLLGIYDKKGSKDFGSCQIGLALAALGSGDHAEAVRLISNVLKIAQMDDFVVTNALAGLLNMGMLENAYREAVSAETRFPGLPSVLERVDIVFEDTLDFASAARVIARRIEVGDDSQPREVFERRRQLMLDLASRADQLSYPAEHLRALAVHATECLRHHGQKIFWVALRGNRIGSVSLEMYVGASPEQCAELNYEVGEALFDKFGDRTAADLVPISIRSHVGRMSSGSNIDRVAHA
jgi:hypothetical protein